MLWLSTATTSLSLIPIFFAKWNETELDSYLMEITRDILGFRDEKGEAVVDQILDTAGQKGTGKWTSESALEEGIPLTLKMCIRDRGYPALSGGRNCALYSAVYVLSLIHILRPALTPIFSCMD